MSVRAPLGVEFLSEHNNGYAPATHLRLVAPKILRTIVNHEDENMTVKYEREGTSVVAFLPRVTSGGSFSVDTSIYRTPPSNPLRANFSLADFGSNIKDFHSKPYSFIATYDQGSTKFNPPSLQVNGYPSYSTTLHPSPRLNRHRTYQIHILLDILVCWHPGR